MTTPDAGNRLYEIFQAIDVALAMARDGVDVMRAGEAGKHMHGVNNAVIWSQNCTYMLENLNGKVPNWPEWWADRVVEMKADPLMQFFHRLRTQILKAAKINLVILQLKKPVTEELLKEIGPPPQPGAQLFIEAKRGWYWQYQDGNGELRQLDIAWPSKSCGPKRTRFVSTGEAKLPSEFSDVDAADLCEMYIAKIEALAEQAATHFFPQSSTSNIQ